MILSDLTQNKTIKICPYSISCIAPHLWQSNPYWGKKITNSPASKQRDVKNLDQVRVQLDAPLKVMDQHLDRPSKISLAAN